MLPSGPVDPQLHKQRASSLVLPQAFHEKLSGAAVTSAPLQAK
jgi:hypothetical protein